MPSETFGRGPAKPQQMGAAPPADQEPLPCPRCDSTNTKFCYYNNYNFSQPRHFCKSCRRYWTHGGTLRDIPVGGGSRKNAKRSRTINTFISSSTATTAPVACSYQDPIPAAPLLISLSGSAAGPYVSDVLLKPSNVGIPTGSFTSLLNASGPGLLSLGGFGLGLGTGFDDVGFGHGRGIWPFPEVGYLSTGVGSVGGSGVGCESNGNGTAWQLESGRDGGFVGGDCFSSWPELAISAPGNGLK
ncbi:hypothetical protein Nepgr_025937 [Nepenthes gracilis]|uniref:Dof zinc finger protein n=1 Tax=Nepenthes gracilis TaxID=150966 RepID=A0AAD3T7Z5_NEPGR|nr:hypothetical protein Nepgr_025937 [Nepenthes gracilis]